MDNRLGWWGLDRALLGADEVPSLLAVLCCGSVLHLVYPLKGKLHCSKAYDSWVAPLVSYDRQGRHHTLQSFLSWDYDCPFYFTL